MNYDVCPESEATHIRFHNGVVECISVETGGDYMAGGKYVGEFPLSALKAIGAIQAWLKVRVPERWGGECEVECFNEDQSVYLAIPAEFRGKTVKVTIEEVIEEVVEDE